MEMTEKKWAATMCKCVGKVIRFAENLGLNG
jgi:hypothetical protein